MNQERNGDFLLLGYYQRCASLPLLTIPIHLKGLEWTITVHLNKNGMLSNLLLRHHHKDIGLEGMQMHQHLTEDGGVRQGTTKLHHPHIHQVWVIYVQLLRDKVTQATHHHPHTKTPTIEALLVRYRHISPVGLVLVYEVTLQEETTMLLVTGIAINTTPLTRTCVKIKKLCCVKSFPGSIILN